MAIPLNYRRSGAWLKESCNRCKYLGHAETSMKFTCLKYFAFIENTSICDSFEDTWNLSSSESLKLSAEKDRKEFREKLKQLENEGKITDLQGRAKLKPENFEPYKRD